MWKLCVFRVVYMFLLIGGALANYQRPQLIIDSLEHDRPVYYFGVGSNMLKSKVVNRGINGTKIGILSMVPAQAMGYRLAFNLRGIPPIEPAMAGIEQCSDDSCHGALIKMKAKEYEKLWASEGGTVSNPGYNEIIIDCVPYGSKKTIKAVCLTAASHAKLSKDYPISTRYMGILLEGARELGLETSYIDRLSVYPTAKINQFVKVLMMAHLSFISFLFRNNLRYIGRFITKLLWLVYIPPFKPTSSYRFRLIKHVIRIVSDVLLASILIPGAILGTFVTLSYSLRGKERPRGFLSSPPPQVKKN